MKITIDLSRRTYSRISHSEIIPDDLNAKVARGILNGKIEEQPKTGHWIRRDYWSEGVGMGESYGYYYQCSECKETIQGGYMKCDSKYCPNCGSKMVESEETK